MIQDEFMIPDETFTQMHQFLLQRRVRKEEFRNFLEGLLRNTYGDFEKHEYEIQKVAFQNLQEQYNYLHDQVWLNRNTQIQKDSNQEQEDKYRKLEQDLEDLRNKYQGDLEQQKLQVRQQKEQQEKLNQRMENLINQLENEKQLLIQQIQNRQLKYFELILDQLEPCVNVSQEINQAELQSLQQKYKETLGELKNFIEKQHQKSLDNQAQQEEEGVLKNAQELVHFIIPAVNCSDKYKEALQRLAETQQDGQVKSTFESIIQIIQKNVKILANLKTCLDQLVTSIQKHRDLKIGFQQEIQKQKYLIEKLSYEIEEAQKKNLKLIEQKEQEIVKKNNIFAFRFSANQIDIFKQKKQNFEKDIKSNLFLLNQKIVQKLLMIQTFLIQRQNAPDMNKILIELQSLQNYQVPEDLQALKQKLDDQTKFKLLQEGQNIFVDFRNFTETMINILKDLS